MEHREPPRIVSTADGRSREPLAEALPLAPRRHIRRLRPHGMAAAVSLGVVALIVGLWLVRLVGLGLVSHVHSQSTYQLAFRNISLDPDPPAWLKGGRESFLEHIRTESRLPAEFSVLDLDLGPLKNAFRRSPWVRDVGRVRKGVRNQLTIPITYREVVALARFKLKVEYAVDSEGVLLPIDAIDLEKAGPLIYLQDFPRPLEPQSGVAWQGADGSASGARPDSRIARAAALCGLLHKSLEKSPELNTGNSRIFLLSEPTGFWVQVGSGDSFDFFRWGEPGERSELNDQEKLAMMLERLRSRPPGQTGSRHFRFTRQGLVANEG